MDCPTEEGLIRKRLEKIKGIERLNFDLMNRRLDVQHTSVDLAGILAALHEIGMQAREGLNNSAPLRDNASP